MLWSGLRRFSGGNSGKSTNCDVTLVVRTVVVTGYLCIMFYCSSDRRYKLYITYLRKTEKKKIDGIKNVFYSAVHIFRTKNACNVGQAQ